MRSDELDPLPYTEGYPSLMSVSGRVDVHSLAAKFLADSRITGAYLEFGVGKGRSAISALRAYTRERVCNRYVLCDSFEGLPELSGVDSDSRQFQKGDYAFNQEAVEVFFQAYGVSGLAPVEFLKGWFGADTKSRVQEALGDDELAVVHVDVDLYESCRWVLEAVSDRLRPGVVMLFDDWNCFNASNRFGERRATIERLEANPGFALNELTSYGWHGRAFVFDRA